MRKVLALVWALSMLFTVVPAYADDLDVQAVGGGAQPKPSEPMRFDDVAFGKPYKIPGYATVTLLGFKFVNMFAQWDEGKASVANRDSEKYGYQYYPDRFCTFVFAQNPKEISKSYRFYENCSFKYSGNEAEFAWLKVDVQNLQKADVSFIKDIKIKVIYDDEYEYNGWIRQFNLDYSKSEIYRYKETTAIGWPVCLAPVDELPVSPMYKGHYVFGCTLPNFIVEDKKSPLRMVMYLGEHELTLNIRK